MNLTDKGYPYPVLTPSGDDYEKSEFDVTLDVLKQSDKVTLTFTPTLRDNGLRSLIGVDKAAKIIIHVESPMTVYRRTFDIPLPVCDTASEKEKTVVEIPAAELSGVVSVCPFIVASQDIPAYTNEAFNPEYEGEAFSIDCGAVLAEGRQRTFIADTAREALALSPSVFKVIKSASADCKTLRNNFNGDKIVITMPIGMYMQYGTLKDSPELREIIWAMVFVPALVEILATLAMERKNGEDGLSEYTGRNWYRSIDKAIRRLNGWGIDSDQFQQYGDYLQLASLLVKNSIRTAFAKLKAE